jgi:phosphate transport system substrate-binding protein
MIHVAVGCGGEGGAGRRTLISIDGSSTVYPIAEAIAEEFQLENPRIMVTPGRSGTGGGFDRFCRGETDISTASRRILEREEAECRAQGVAYVELPVAVDGLSVIVSHQNDFVDCLTVEELRRIWRPGSRVRTWRDVRPEFPGAEIQLYGPGTDSGTYDTFTEAIVGEVGASRTDFQASEDDNVLVQGITGDRYALGFFGYAYLAGNRDRLGVVAVDGGAGCISPTEETVRQGSYAPLSRPLFLYVKRASLGNAGLQEFLRYFMNHAGEIVSETGFVPLPDTLYQVNLRQLGLSEGGRGKVDLEEGSR